MTKTILVIAAHSDDEALGCAGTMAKHTAAGDQVHVLFMTDGVGSRLVAEDEVSVRQSTAQKAMDVLGVVSMENLNFPDNKMDSVPLLDVTQSVEKVISKLKPEIIYTHHIGDLNIDHQVAHKAVMTVCRPQPNFCVKEIYAFEVLSSTEWQTPDIHPFLPNVFVDISQHIKVKEKALNAYCEEMRKEPHSRSIKNAIRLNAARGNSVGVNFAEAFVLLRQIK